MVSDVFQCYLDHLAEAIPPDPGKRRLLILDNASWHKAARLQWHHFEVRFLPGYSPDFNPIERLWLRMKADYFSDFIARTPDELTERLCTALNASMDDQKRSPHNALPGNDFRHPLLTLRFEEDAPRANSHKIVV